MNLYAHPASMEYLAKTIVKGSLYKVFSSKEKINVPLE